jgi:hypothetical protein
MSNAAARVLRLFLRTPTPGVTGVTHVTGRSVTSETSIVTPLTSVTCEKQQSPKEVVARTKLDVQDGLDNGGIDFEERAAIIEYDGGAPRPWAEALARLDPNKPPGDVPQRRWHRFIDDAARFVDGGWADRADALGWGPLDLVGADRERPFARIENQGLLWLLSGGKIVELHRDKAVIETERGCRQCYRRRPVEVGRVVLAWELVNAVRRR